MNLRTTTWLRKLVSQRRLMVLSAVFLVSFEAHLALAAASVEDPADVGDLTIVSAVDATSELENGDSSTFWNIQLPSGSTCPGDSANDQWRTQSFLLPLSVDPVDQVYGPIGPEPWDNGERFALFKADTEPYVHELLEKNSSPGSPGAILPIPTMNFEVLASEQIPTGTYRMGIACSYFGKTAKWWDTQIVIEPVAGEPARLTWRLVDAPAFEAPSTTNIWSIIAVICGVAGLVVLGLVVVQARRDKSEATRDVAATGPGLGATSKDLPMNSSRSTHELS